MNSQKPDRDAAIVADLQVHASSEIALKYHVKRQRIEQIYERETGEPYKILVLRKKAQREKARQNSVKYVCVACSRKVRHKDSKSPKRKYCEACALLPDYQTRDLSVTRNCLNCRQPYHPLRNSLKTSKFDSRKCSNEYYRRKRQEAAAKNSPLRAKP